MMDEWDELGRDEFSRDERVREVWVRRAPSPGVAAVLSFFVPGLGQVYAGRLLAGAIWFLATGFAYWMVLLPGFLVHAVCIWSAYQSCDRAPGHGTS